MTKYLVKRHLDPPPECSDKGSSLQVSVHGDHAIRAIARRPDGSVRSYQQDPCAHIGRFGFWRDAVAADRSVDVLTGGRA
ncbi:hypothetical protein Acy02nite_51670 [Actinoplanes cyaneus]|uniref:Uncharacterized protein n=1 Tax=Actinoplanes cyaneus TaxID=52696 RepID=A0A919IMB2_9ACTN|nr:hypothetical protein Acy02nite_51670 [Actinoplanes cyaneus]